MNTKLKFAIIITLVVGTLGWLAAGGINETKTYYTTVAELGEMGDAAHGRRLRVAGDVKEGSISRDGREVRFTLVQEHLTLPVVYDGAEPLPDTFRDGAQALADGRGLGACLAMGQPAPARCRALGEEGALRTLARPALADRRERGRHDLVDVHDRRLEHGSQQQ